MRHLWEGLASNLFLFVSLAQAHQTKVFLPTAGNLRSAQNRSLLAVRGLLDEKLKSGALDIFA